MRSPSTSRSTSPQSNASLAPIGLPVAHISSALPTPATRGSRCVPPAPGSSPSLTSGVPSFADWIGDAIMAAERDLEPAAERGAVDRRDDRLGAILDRVDDHRQPRLLRRLAELGDVGAGEEGLALAGDDDGFDAVVGLPPRRSHRPAPAGPRSTARSPAGCCERTISTSPCLRVEIGLVVGLSSTSVMRPPAKAATARPSALQAGAVAMPSWRAP